MEKEKVQTINKRIMEILRFIKIGDIVKIIQRYDNGQKSLDSGSLCFECGHMVVTNSICSEYKCKRTICKNCLDIGQSRPLRFFVIILRDILVCKECDIYIDECIEFFSNKIRSKKLKLQIQ